jgi:phospholipid/cholesterol/gamma-HCH transport system substrate-binding protein
MSTTFTPPVRFSRLVLKVNAFLLIALILVGAFLGLVAYKQGWFLHQSTIRFITPNALGINKGMPVKLYGFTIGQVSSMELSREGVEVHLSITSEYLQRIPKGSKAKHARESGVVGASVIEILPAASGPALAEGERIDFQPSRGISEIIDDFRKQAVPAFNEVKQLFSQLKGPAEDMTASVSGLRREIDRLPETHKALQRVLVSTERTLQAAERTLQSAERATASIENAVPRLTDKLATAIDSLDGAAVQLRKTGEEAQGTLQRARPILERGEVAARDAGDVINAAKRIWPLSDSLRDGNDRELPIDSFEGRAKAAPRL